MAAYASILELIGNTPMVEVSQLSPNPRARILVKLEGKNPGGSSKDRVALSLVERAEEDGPSSPASPVRCSSNRRRATPASGWPSSAG